MRKLSLTLILPLLMLLAQHGALCHEIGHLREAALPAGIGQHDPADKVCDVCLAFAHMAVAAKPEMPVMTPARFSHAVPVADAVPFAEADAPPARSRGPPRWL